MKKSQEPKISVIMSVYNGMPYIKEAVNSILKQTYKKFEFIIIDDASSDDTLKYLKSLKDKRLVPLENKKNIGLAASLNKGLRKASGDYIARMDADDVSMLNRFEKQILFLQKNPSVDICGTWAKLIDEKSRVIAIVKKPLIDRDIKKMNMLMTGIIHPTWVAKRYVFETLKGYQGRYDLAEDLDFLLRAKDFKMANLKDNLLLWRSSQKRRSKQDVERMYRKSLLVRWNHFRQGNLPPSALMYLIRSVITTYLFPSNLKIFLNKKSGLI